VIPLINTRMSFIDFDDIVDPIKVRSKINPFSLFGSPMRGMIEVSKFTRFDSVIQAHHDVVSYNGEENFFVSDFTTVNADPLFLKY
jgi:hypothetical protein